MAKKSSPLRSLVLFLLMLAGGMAFGYLIGGMFSDNPESLKVPGYFHLVWLALLPLGYFIGIGWHELGHTLVGIGVGFEFRSFTIGPFSWEMEDEKLGFKWNKNLNILGGLALCIPTGEEGLKKRFMWYIAGGPLASLLGALLFGSLFFFTRSPGLGFGSYLWEAFCLANTMFHSLFFVATIIPTYKGGFYSDGARLKNLLTQNLEGQIDVIMTSAIARSMSGTRPREWDVSGILHGLSLNSGSGYVPFLHSYLQKHYLDKGDMEQAREQLDLVLSLTEDLPEAIRSSFFLDEVIMRAGFEAQPELAQTALEKFVPSIMVPKSLIEEAKGLVSRSQGDEEAAMAHFQEAQDSLSQHMDRGLAVAQRERLEKWLQAPQ
ncbi:MAG: hypothetical protein AAFR61_12095 [Bacteroidota bacterium]